MLTTSPQCDGQPEGELWFTGVVLAMVLVWSSRFFVNPDGVSLLDLSDDIASGQWGSAVNAHWGPLYPAILSRSG